MRIFALLHLIAVPGLAAAVVPGSNADLASLKTSYEAAIARETTPLMASYHAELDALKVQLTKAGDMADAALVDNERKGVRQTLPRDASKLRALKAAHEAAIDKAIGPLKKTYFAELGRLKTMLTSKGDLPGALAVDTEIKAMAPTAIRSGGPATAALTKRELEQLLTSGRWSFMIDVGTRYEAVRGTATFKSDGSVNVSWFNPGGKWEIADNGRLKYRPGTTWECVFTWVNDTRFDGTGTGGETAKNGKMRLIKVP